MDSSKRGTPKQCLKTQQSLQTPRNYAAQTDRRQSEQVQSQTRLSVLSGFQDRSTVQYDEGQSTQIPYEPIFRNQQSIILDEDIDYEGAQVYETAGNPLSSMYYMLHSHQIASQYPMEMYDENRQRSQTQRTGETKFKTEMCKNWEETGRCNYGRKCQFAHGRNEININPTVMTNVKYKSRVCNQFLQQDVFVLTAVDVCLSMRIGQFKKSNNNIFIKVLKWKLNNQRYVYTNSVTKSLLDNSRLKQEGLEPLRVLFVFFPCKGIVIQ